METVRVVFKGGVFVPVDGKTIPEGSEGIVVFLPKKKEAEKPKWWNLLELNDEKKEALHYFSAEVLKRVSVTDIKVVTEAEGFEVFVLVYDEFESLKPIMEVALKVYEEKGVYIPVQVISSRRLERWKEQRNRIYDSIVKGVSIR